MLICLVEIITWARGAQILILYFWQNVRNDDSLLLLFLFFSFLIISDSLLLFVGLFSYDGKTLC